MMLCELNDITKTYPIPTGSGFLKILDSISLRINKGESVAILGPSGSGKTTLLNIASALDIPDSGHVVIDDCDLAGLSKDQLALIRNRKIGIVFQKHHLLPQCTLLENVLVPTLPYQNKDNKGETLSRALELLDRMGLSERHNHFPSQLSGGECQRVTLARALINKPGLLCADEPTGSLDRMTAKEMAKLLAEINREENTALLIVTHSPELASRMDRRMELFGGRLKERV